MNELAAAIRADLDKYTRVVKTAGIKRNRETYGEAPDVRARASLAPSRVRLRPSVRDGEHAQSFPAKAILLVLPRPGGPVFSATA